MRELVSLMNFMYHGEVNVSNDELNGFLSVADDLKVKGLSQYINSGVHREKPPVFSDKSSQISPVHHDSKLPRTEGSTEPPLAKKRKSVASHQDTSQIPDQNGKRDCDNQVSSPPHDTPNENNNTQFTHPQESVHETQVNDELKYLTIEDIEQDRGDKGR